MKEAKTRATLCVLGCGGWLLLAAVMMRCEIYFPVVLGMVFGMLCAADSFIHGREFEIERRREIMEEKYDWPELEPGMVLDGCEKCGCQEFYVVAGRLVCMCCGEVMKHE